MRALPLRRRASSAGSRLERYVVVVEPEEECPPTVPSSRLAPCLPLARKASPGLLHTLKELLSQAEEGKLVGVTFLCNHGNETNVYYAGTINLHDELMAFEDYKFQRMLERNTRSNDR